MFASGVDVVGAPFEEGEGFGFCLRCPGWGLAVGFGDGADCAGDGFASVAGWRWRSGEEDVFVFWHGG